MHCVGEAIEVLGVDWETNKLELAKEGATEGANSVHAALQATLLFLFQSSSHRINNPSLPQLSTPYKQWNAYKKAQ